MSNTRVNLDDPVVCAGVGKRLLGLIATGTEDKLLLVEWRLVVDLVNSRLDFLAAERIWEIGKLEMLFALPSSARH